MPEKVKSRRATSKTRKGSSERDNHKKYRCKRINGSKTKTPGIIANSLFALTLGEKSGIEVSMHQQCNDVFVDSENGIEEIYYDLLETLQNSLKLYTGEGSNFDPYKSGMSLDTSILYIINAFKNNILPTGFELNIDHNNKSGYHFTIYNEIETVGYWMSFEIKPIVKKLWRTNVPLHEFFIVFLKSFMYETGIQNWYNGGLGYAEYAVEEHMEEWENFEGDFDSYEKSEKERRKRLATVWEYEHGEVKQYQKIISSATAIPVEELLQELSRFNKRNNIVKWMYEACEFIKIGGSIYDFIYEEAISEDYNEEGVRFEQQATFIWDSKDIYSITEEEVLDAEAQGCGVQNAFLNIHISKNTESIDWSNLEKLSTWVNKLEDLNESYIKLINSITRR